MGKKDVYQFDYLDDYERFADQVNGALFGGRQIVKPEELEPTDERNVYLGNETERRMTYEVVADKTRIWHGKQIHIIALQNQTYTDYRMVLRNMLSESIGYHKQWKQKKRVHEKAKDFEIGSNEFLSGMAKDEKFIPIITIVVYCGTEHGWDGAKCLHDLLDIDDEMKEYVTNYRMNLYDCHAHDTFNEYRTGLRQLFETIRYGGDQYQLERVIKENKEAYSNMDSETRKLLEVVANVKVDEKHITMENGKERYNMLKAFEDRKAEGKIEDILDLLDELGQVPQRITDLIRAEKNSDVLRKWLKTAAKAESIEEFEKHM